MLILNFLPFINNRVILIYLTLSMTLLSHFCKFQVTQELSLPLNPLEKGNNQFSITNKFYIQSTFSANPINIPQIHLHIRAMEAIFNSKFQWIHIRYVSPGSNPTKIRNFHRLGWRKKKKIVRWSMDHPLIQYDTSRR